MPLQTNVRRRGATYHFRARVPADLAERFGRLELARTLGTSNPTDARRRAAGVAQLVHQIVTAVRDNPSMTPDDIANLVRAFHAATLADHRELAALAPLSPRAAEQKEREDRQRPALMRALAGDIATGRMLLTQAIADELLERHGLAVVRESVAYADLCAALARARLAALGEVDAGASGIEVPPDLLPPAPSEPLPSPAATMPAPAASVALAALCGRVRS